MRLQATLVLAALTLCGCFSGLQSKTPPIQRYLLQLPEAPTVTATASEPAVPRGTALSVQAPIGAPGLNTDAIAVLRAGNRSDYFRGSSWVVPAPVMLQGLVIETLRRAGRFAAVEPEASAFSATDFLSIEVTHFEAQYDGAPLPSVHVALVLTLGRRADGSVVTSLTAESRVMAADDRMQAVIAAFQRATDEALMQLAALVPAAPAPN